MKKIVLILLIICISIYACKKENLELNTVQIGNVENMILTKYDTILVGGNNEAKSIDLDLNNDNLNDFRLTSEVRTYPGEGPHPEAILLCLNENSHIMGQLVSDTTFYRDFVDSYNEGNGPPLYIHYYYRYSNHRDYETDSIISIQTNVFKVDFLNEDDIIYHSNEYQSDNFVLTESWSAEVSGPYPNITNDTMRIFTETHWYNGNVIPEDRLTYIGFKLKDADKEKLGWIKLRVIDNYIIILLETAVQE